MKYSRIKCPKCQADFGQEARFLDHLTDVHGVTDHLSLFLELFKDGTHPTCGCRPGCDAKLPWAGWKKGFTSTFARGHNARLDSVYLDKEKQKQFVAKRVEGYRSGRIRSWNKGLSKETDERVARQSENIAVALNEGYASGSIVDWHKRDPEKAKNAAIRSSQTKVELYASGQLVPWNKGLTKATSAIVASSAESIKRNYGINPGSSARRLSNDEFLQPKDSKAQLELYEFVKALAPDAILSDKDVISPSELDIYVPSRKFGIEYDGLYWHSELNVDDAHAARKSSACHNAGIKLLGIFEDEWRDKRQVVESMIRHRLGINNERIGARKCELKELTVAERRSFIDRCHIDGDVRAAGAWGLFNGSKLVAAMSIRRPFHRMHADTMEVARFCVEPGTSVPGALGRLSSRAIEHVKSLGKRALMTYVDRRIGQADGYVAAGFRVVRETAPRFWWTDFVNRYNRFQFKADSKNGITQEQVAKEAGVVKIWGCKNVLLELA